ncbi:hypothetical protein ACFVSU_12595 [Microbacterium sp. NPDC058062]|uniref:hypothetical protein n=1 Tax=Microbacterium sp. NPDC058062 TaxID=3346320 RepID=UPI0036DA7DCD
MPPIDPTALALLSIFGGVVLTIIAGGIGALIQHRRENTKWLRDNRLRVYSGFLSAVEQIGLGDDDPEYRRSVDAAAVRAVGALQLLGPDEVAHTASKFMKEAHAHRMALRAYRDERLPANEALLAEANDQASMTRAMFVVLASRHVGAA